MSDGINKVGVVGLGTMGAGIVEVFARNGYDVVGLDLSDTAHTPTLKKMGLCGLEMTNTKRR